VVWSSSGCIIFSQQKLVEIEVMGESGERRKVFKKKMRRENKTTGT
jgi:hypothetical protein